MFIVNDDLSIYATRGDIVFFQVTAEDNGVKYKFQPGDVVRFTVYGKKDARSVVLQKDFPVTEISEYVFIHLDEAETRIGEVISKPTDYWYEVELNPGNMPQTIIGYDEDGAKLFKLFPEGEEIHYEEPKPQEIPVVDDKLDMTSPRPVANKAVASAIASMMDVCEKTNAAVADMYVTPQMFGAVGDGVADDTEAIQHCLDNYKDVVLPAGTYVISKSLTMTKEGQTLKGMSSDAIIKAADGFEGDMLVMDGTLTPAYRSNQSVSSLGIKGNGECNGLRFYMNADFFVRNVKVSNCLWGIVSSDSLLYHVFGTMVAECTNGVKFENSAKLSAANNVCFDMCQIISIAKYAIYSESGDSTHNAVFQCCEIEATNTDKEDISPITLQSKSSSGASPIMVFRNCWLEQNHGTIPVLITGSDGYQKQYIFDGCTIMNSANSCDYFISATGRTLVMLNQSDPCTYNKASIKLANGRLFILGGLFSYEADDEEKVTHLGYDGYVNSSIVFRNSYGTHYKSLGGADHNKIFAQSNKLKIVADTDLLYLDGAKGVELSNSFVKPMKLGSMYLWAYNEKLYVKYGSTPTAYNDGTVLISLE